MFIRCTQSQAPDISITKLFKIVKQEDGTMRQLSRSELDRISRKQSILEAAEKVFVKKGYENTSVSDIAKEAVFTKTTIYKYFPTKNIIYYYVALKGYEHLKDAFIDASKSRENGYEELVSLFHTFNTFYMRHPRLFQIMGSIHHIKSANEPLLEESGWYELWEHLIEFFEKALRRGVHDGSIKKDVPITETSYSLFYYLTGFYHQYYDNFNAIKRHPEINQERMLSLALDLLIQNLRS